MASEKKCEIFMPDLNTGEGQTVLELTTDAINSQIVSTAAVHRLHEGNITFELCGDYRKYPRRTKARGTQANIDAQHSSVFTPENIKTIIADVRAFYADKQKEEDESVPFGDALDDFNYVGSRHHY